MEEGPRVPILHQIRRVSDHWKDLSWTTVIFLANTNYAIDYEFIDPENRFHGISNWWPGRAWLAFRGYFRSVWKCVLLVQWYKSLAGWLSSRVSSLQNSTARFFSLSTLKMPVTRTYHQRSFTPFPITYSSESFAPLVREDRQISHIRYLLRGQHAALTHFCHYLTDCSTIFALEQTLQELRDNCDHVFADFTTPDVIYRLQPFLIQSRRRSLALASIATTTTVTDTSSTHSWPPTRQPQHAPTVQLPQTHHDNLPIIVTIPRATPVVTPVTARTPTPIPTTSTSLVQYVSPLVARFNPCNGCGSVDGHFPGCSDWSRSPQS